MCRNMTTMAKPKPSLESAIRRPPGTIPVAEAAKRIGLDRVTLWKWFMDGHVRGWRHATNRRVYIFEAECERILREAVDSDPTRKR